MVSVRVGGSEGEGNCAARVARAFFTTVLLFFTGTAVLGFFGGREDGDGDGVEVVFATAAAENCGLPSSLSIRVAQT